VTKTILITGIWGQDGTILAQSLLKKGYHVLGLARPDSSRTPTIQSKDLEIVKVDLRKAHEVNELFKRYSIQECYHLAACHHESTKEPELSFEQDSEMIETNFNSTQNLIHAILNNGNKARLFNAGSSQMFTPQSFGHVFNEGSPYNPTTIYGHTKVFSANLIDYYRRNHNFYGVTGVLFNHESPLRSPKFISRLITQAAAKISRGKLDKLNVRNPFSVTDWSAASDFVEGYQISLKQDKPQDLIFASGKQHRVMDIIEICFEKLGLDTSRHLEFPSDAQPSKTSLIGDSSNLRSLGWKPQKSFRDFVLEMLEADLKNL
jgi:GDPmannose 4,6-dehydratase